MARPLVWVCFTLVVLFTTEGAAWAFGPRYSLYGKARLGEVEAPNVLKMKMLDGHATVCVRLLGVGSPRNRDRIKNLGPNVLVYIQENQLWEESRGYVRSLLNGKVVEVWTRKWDRYDDKNRLLAYIRVPAENGDPVDLNGEIIRNGMGFVTRDYVHVTFADYRELEDDARKHQRGIWKGLTWKQISQSR